MKKILLSILLLLFALILTACSTSNTAQIGSKQESDGLSIAAQLAIGTLQLEGTDQAVTSEQAKELLPMWQVYQSLTGSGSAAQAEIDGLVEQIQQTLTTEQMASITAMNLTQQDLFAAIQAQNITTSSSSGQSSNSGGVSFGPPDGGMPGGGPPDAGMGGDASLDGGMSDMGGTGSDTSTGQNQEAEAGPGLESSAGVPTALIDALIQYLEQVASS